MSATRLWTDARKGYNKPRTLPFAKVSAETFPKELMIEVEFWQMASCMHFVRCRAIGQAWPPGVAFRILSTVAYRKVLLYQSVVTLR